MKHKILSLFLALTMLMPLTGAFELPVAADDYVEPYTEWGNIMTLERYDMKLDAIKAQKNKTDEELVEDTDYKKVLMQRKLLEKVGYDNLQTNMAKSEDFAACMEWLFGDYETLHDYVFGGAPETVAATQKVYKYPTPATYINSFNVLTRLYTAHKEDVEDSDENHSLYKRMMISLALTHCVTVYDWHYNNPYNRIHYKWTPKSDALERYELYKKWYNLGMLADKFDKYSAEELRMVVSAPTDNLQLEWLHHLYRVKYFGNANYAESMKQATQGNIGNIGIKYAVVDTAPQTTGGKPYVDPANYDAWNNKWLFEKHDDYFDFKLPYGPNEKGQYYEPQWLTFQTGGVCTYISYSASVIKNAFGLAAMRFFQAPDHSSFTVYRVDHSTGVSTWSNDYDAYGLNVSAFCELGQTHLLTDWAHLPYNDQANFDYASMGGDAVHNRFGTDYEKAEMLAYMGDIRYSKEDYEGALALYEKALTAQYFNMTAWTGIGNAYEALEKTDADYYALARRAGENLKWYPQPMFYYIIRFIYPKIQSQVYRADMIKLTDEFLAIGASSASNSAGLSQPGWCRTYANYYRGKLTKIAGFSFNTGLITLNGAFRNAEDNFLYSFDKGQTWNTHEYTEGEASFKLTDEEIAQITAANGIYYKFEHAEYTHGIGIGTYAAPASNLTVNTPNDDEDKFTNLQSGLEYSIDSGATWQDLTTSSHFPGEVSVWVRRKRNGVYLASPHIVVNFKPSEDTPERRYLPILGNVKAIATPPSMSANPASNALDTKKNTYWEKMYTNINYSIKKDEDGNLVPKYDDEFVFEIAEPHYISGIGYVPSIKGTYDGTISACEVYISNDNVNWQLAGSTSNWAYIKSNTETYPREQYIDFDEPVYTKYVKIKVIKAGLYYRAAISANCGYATAAEFKLYENELCPAKEVQELTLTVDSAKTSYKIGDKLDFGSITPRLVYTDGTTSILPASELSYSVDIFDSTDITEVNASYKGAKASFPVTVSENDRVAAKFSAATPSSRKYYASDKLQKENVLLQVTDGTEKWYLLNDEFEFENSVLAEGKNTIKVILSANNEITTNVTVNAEKAVKEIRIDTDETGDDEDAGDEGDTEETKKFKTQYFIGDPMDLGGMSVKLVYADETEKELTASEYKLELFRDGDKPLEASDFARTAGTNTIKVSLNDKSEIYDEKDVTIFSYITQGEFSFEALEGETSCKLTGFEPVGDMEGRTVTIPETIIVGGHEYKVVEIAGSAFVNAAETQAVTIPSSIKSIEEGAFASCKNLKRIYMTDYTSFDGFECDDNAFPEVENGYVYLNSSLEGTPSPIKGYTASSIAHEAESITVTPPEKTEYILGDEFDRKGMVVTAILKDGSSTVTNAYTISGFDSEIAGEQTVTVTLDGSTLNSTVTVNVSFPKVTIEKSPLGGVYSEGDTIKPISVNASAENGRTVLYQWYRSETEEKNGTAIENAAGAEYTPSGAGYYYAAAYVKDKNGDAGETVYSDIANIMVGDYEAIIGTRGYETLNEAVQNASDNAIIKLCKDVIIDETIRATGKKFTIDGGGHTIHRGSGFNLAFFIMREKSVVTMKNVTLDGGAVWTGDEDEVVKHGLTNSGKAAICPFVLEYEDSELILQKGAILQNNYNAGTLANENTANVEKNLTGGAVWTIDSTLTLDGGIIRNNASTLFGSAVYMRGTSVLTSYKGEVTGNFDPQPTSQYNASAVCTDNDTTVNIQDGTFSNNKGGTQGGVFWIGHGTLIISGGTFENNYTYGSGGVGYFYQSGSKATLTLTGGVFRNNKAEASGGAFYCGKASRLAGGTFENNSATNGGALWINQSGIVLSGNTFKNNTASANGGALWSGTAVEVSGDNFEGNTAQKGEAIYMNGSPQLTIGNIANKMQDVYLQTFKTINITGAGNTGKPLRIETDTTVLSNLTVAYVTYGEKVNLTINGFDTVLTTVNNKWYLTSVVTPNITYNTDDGEIENINDYTSYTAGTGLTLPVPQKRGCTFDGWFDNAELTGEAIEAVPNNVNDDKEYWAKWSANTYTVTLNTDDGELSEELTSYTYGQGAALPKPSKEGFVFAGWFDNEEFTGIAVADIGTDEIDNKEYWAKWVENGYYVALHTNDGILTENLSVYVFGEGAVLPIPSKEGHTFEGWFDNADFAGTAVTEIGTSDTGDKEFWAKWTVNTYTVTLNPDGGTLLEDLTSYTYGEGATLPTPVKDGYTFEGWYESSDFSDTAITEIGTHETGDKQFWAKWTINEYAIIFENYNGDVLQEGNVAFGTTPNYSGDVPVKEGDDRYSYKFAGWDPDITSVSGDAVYTAQFEKIPIAYFVEYTDSKALVLSPTAGEFNVIFAAYNSDNALIGVEVVPVIFTEAGEQTVEPKTFAADDASEIKVMLWNNLKEMYPLCKPAFKSIIEN